MTNEEAIEILNGDKDIWRELGYESISEFNKDWDIAFNMAIKALEEVSNLSENLHREREQAYMSGYEEGRKSLLDGLSGADW